MRPLLAVPLFGLLLAAACGGATTTVGDGEGGRKLPPDDDGTGLMAGGTCAGDPGGPIKLATSAERTIIWIGVDATHVYYATQSNMTISRVPKCGGAVEELAKVRNSAPGAAVALTTNHVVFGDQGGIMRMPKTGLGAAGVPEKLGPFAVAYLAADDAMVAANTNDGLARCDVPGSCNREPAKLWHALAIDETSIYHRRATAGDPNQRFSLVRAPRTAQGPYEVLAPEITPQGAMALDKDRVYFTTFTTMNDGRVLSVSKNAAQGEPAHVIAEGQGPPLGVAVDDTFVYWANQSGTIRAAPKGGGAAITLASSKQPEAIATDGAYVYWAEYREGVVYAVKAPPKR